MNFQTIYCLLGQGQRSRSDVEVKGQGQRSGVKVRCQGQRSRSEIKVRGQGQRSRSRSRSEVDAMPATRIPPMLIFFINQEFPDNARCFRLSSTNLRNVLLSSERLREDTEKTVEKGHFSSKTEKKVNFQTILW